MQRFSKQNGLTLVEMMIGLAIIGVVITFAIPSAQSIIQQNRIVAEINELSGIVQYARANAINEQVNTLLCPSQNFSNCTNNWDHPKMVFADVNGNGERDADEPLLVGSSAISVQNDLSGPALPIQFQPTGAAFLAATLLLCGTDNDDKYARALFITLQGRVKTSKDTNNDGIYEDPEGVALDCG